MSVLLPENKPFSFLSLIMKRLYRFYDRIPVISSGIPDELPWIINRIGRRAYRATVVKVNSRQFRIRITVRLGAHSKEYRFHSLMTSLDSRTFCSVKAASRAGFALTYQLAQVR
ncbi:hypothetical protein ACK4QX_21450 [Proteus mirabilis]|uniref:hypothetical protein n=1 Tax=Proteus mirabilis TaxID=584 RepID=UPI00391C7304